MPDLSAPAASRLTRGLRLALCGLALLLPSAPARSQPAAAEGPAAIEVRAVPLDGFEVRDPGRRRFGALHFRGGLALTSEHRRFGGLSALHLFADGARFVALSDKGYWLAGRIVYRDKAPVGIAEAQIAPVLGADGRPLAKRGWYDTESLAFDGGIAYVGIERANQIVRLDFGRHGLRARASALDLPPALRRLPHNKGLEALVAVPKAGRPPLAGSLIAIAERDLDRDGNLRAFLVGGPQPGEFAIRRSEDFDASDAALLPGGDLLLLERKYSIWAGVHVRLRRLALADIRPGALVDGKILLHADLGYQIDNLEGLSVHRDADGDTVLTLVSDDNFSPIQRTLLLQFTLAED